MRPNPFPILAGDRESDRLLDVEGVESLADVIEIEDDFGSRHFHRLKSGALAEEVDPVVPGQCPAGESIGDGMLVAGMDVSSFANVDDDRLACMLQFGQRHGLGFAQFGPGRFLRFVDRVAKVCQLNPVERKVALAPLVAPVLDHEGEEVTVLIGSVGVGFALVPYNAFNAVSDCWVQDSVVDVGGPVISSERIARRAGSRAFLAVGVPFGEPRFVLLGFRFVVVSRFDFPPLFEEGSVALVCL